jgi:LCP family protein required for cell wall assembly
MIEDELRAAFARHEQLTPATGPVIAAVEQGYRRRRRGRIALRAAGAAVLAAAILAGPAVAINAVGSSALPRPPGHPAEPDLAPGPLNFLLLGLDRASGEDPGRSDTVLMVHIPAGRDVAYLISLPRDLWVPIPGSGMDRLNSAYARGGFGLATRTVSDLAGVRFDGGVRVTYDGLRELVDALGGIDLYVDEKTTSAHVGFTRDGQRRAPFVYEADGTRMRPVPGVVPQVYQVGHQHLAGWQALDYLRQRYLLANGDGDAGRQRHVRQFLGALLRTVRTQHILADPDRATRLLDSLDRAVTVDPGTTSVPRLLVALGGVSMTVGLAAPTIEEAVRGANPTVRLAPDASRLFTAVQRDDMDSWIAAHPDAVNPQ